MNISTCIKVIVLFILNMVFSAGMLFAQERAIIGKDSNEAEGTDPKAPREEVVTGYSKQLKRNITGAVSVVERSALTTIPSGNVSNQLQGLASGVTVVGNGQPGNTSKVRIRGIGSFAGNDPLYVVDGVPTQDISSLNPNDVESIAVLKDAGAASIYGARAFNGVIVVTTRNGSKGIQVTYNMSVGTQLPGKGPTKDLLNTQEYADLQWLVYANDGYSEAHPIYGPSSNPAPTLPAWAANTDWYDAITNPALLQNHDITFEGNNEKSRYFVGFGYFDQKGIVIHTFAKRYSGRFNSEWTFMNDHVKVGENFTLAFRQSNGVQNLNESNPIQMGPYRSQSIIPVYITEPIESSMHEFLPGEYGGAGIIQRLGNATNVVADLTRNKDNFVNNLRLMGSAFIDIKLLKGLNFRSTVGGTYSTAYQLTYTYATYERSENINSASLQEQVRYDGDWIWTNALSLNRNFGEHSIGTVVGYETVKYGIGRNMSAIRAGYFSDAVSFRTLTNGSTIVNATSNLNAPTTLASEFFRADYGFLDKYLLSATLRWDGASGQNMEKRHILFPSVAAGWRISSEPFLNDIQWLNELKIRGSYGKMGNLNANWETITTANVGFETRLFENRIGFVFDWYSKKTQDLLFISGLPGPQSYINVASMLNNGIDLEWSYKNNWGNFSMNANLMFTTYNNKITGISEGVEFFDFNGGFRIGSLNRNQVGHPIASFYGYQVIGLFRSAAEVTNATAQDGAEAGFFRYANVDNADNAITPNDRTFIGNPNPDFTAGLNLSLTYKNFDLNGFLYISQGNDIYNWNKWWTDFWPSFQGQKSKDLLYNCWTEENTGASTPKAANKSNFSTNTQSCSYYIEDGSYLRLKSLQLGYTIPQNLLSKAKVLSFRIYLQAVNLFTITKYSGLDPEIGGNDLSFGIDNGNYPNAKQFIFGLQVGL